MTLPFIHLKVHSEFSIVDSLLRIDRLLHKAADLSMPAITLTDQTNLFGLVKFYRKAIAVGIKPIIGSDVCIAEKDAIFSITVLCKNQIGYQNLIQLLSRAYIEGQKENRVLIQWEWLIAAKEGLIILSGGRQGDVGQAILQGRGKIAEERLQRWITLFPN